MPAPSASAPASASGTPTLGRDTNATRGRVTARTPYARSAQNRLQREPCRARAGDRAVPGRRARRARARGQGRARRVQVLAGGAPRSVHALAPGLPPVPDGGADVLVPLETAVGLLAPGEHACFPLSLRVLVCASAKLTLRNRPHQSCCRIVAPMGRQNQRTINRNGSSQSGADGCSCGGFSAWHWRPPALQSRPSKTLGNARDGRSSLRLCDRRRGLCRLRGGQPPERGPFRQGCPDRSRRARSRSVDSYSCRLLPQRHQSRGHLAVRLGAGAQSRRPRCSLAAGARARRLERHQRPALRAGTGAGLRRLAPARQRGLVLPGRACPTSSGPRTRSAGRTSITGRVGRSASPTCA